MKLISWNVRGLNSPGKLRMIRSMIRLGQPQIFFLQETKCNSSTLGSILTKSWPGCNTVAVDASGASGGLAIAWNTQKISLSNLHASHNLIEATFHIIGTNIHGHMTNVYFPQEAPNKIALIDTIANLNSNREYSLWLIGGDFNIITKLEEKRGGRAKLDQDSTHFKDFIHNNSLIDLQTPNGVHTWSNRRTGRHQIASKLDRFLISDSVIHLGGDLSALILPHFGSDYWPIALQWQRPGSTKPQHGNEGAPVANNNRRDYDTKENAQYHLLSPKARRGRVEDHTKIEQELVNYFQDVLQEPQIDRSRAIEKITQHIPKVITEDHNQLLLRPVQPEEVDFSMKQLKEGKAPGPDGFSTTFFHSFWELIREEVWLVIEESRSLHWLLPALNSTFITLIPKEEGATTPEKYRPIALCNVIYKFISKVIANRLKPLLPLLISPEQAGYVEGRQIMDGIILTHEIIHSLKTSNQTGMILKIDLSKAFDKLSWTYIQKMLNAFGFDPMWVRWVHSLISSTFFSILINGIPSRPFSPSRGIRQGDPLSPFLFVLMAEGLGRLIKQALHS
eukprot:PITA_19617